MISAPKILVLLSCYNGEKFLKVQLESLQNQKNVDLKILIRDDGSNDKTIDIVKRHMEKYSNVKLIIGENVGSALSFMELMRFAESYKDIEYYSFCDQDDFWLQNKLDVAINKMGYKSNIPSLYCSYAKLVDSELKDLPQKKKSFVGDFKESLLVNPATGCTLVINRKLLEICNSYVPKYFVMHDGWLYRLCQSIGGRVYYDDESYIKYRQHNNNVVGGKTSFFVRWKRRINTFVMKDVNIRYKIFSSLYEGFGDQMTDNNKLLVENILAYKKSFSKRLRLIFDYSIRTNLSKEHNLAFRFAILFGIY